MAAIIVSRFPKKAPELFAYQASIVRAARNYEDDCWVTYDRQFRREALAKKDLDWSVPNIRLYNEAFTGRARTIPRCSFCLQDDHSSQDCSKNPARAWQQWYQVNLMSTQTPQQTHTPLLDPATGQQTCKRFNRGACRDPARCKYKHVCFDCGGSHAISQCPLHAKARSGYNRPGLAMPKRDAPPY